MEILFTYIGFCCFGNSFWFGCLRHFAVFCNFFGFSSLHVYINNAQLHMKTIVSIHLPIFRSSLTFFVAAFRFGAISLSFQQQFNKNNRKKLFGKCKELQLVSVVQQEGFKCFDKQRSIGASINCLQFLPVYCALQD